MNMNYQSNGFTSTALLGPAALVCLCMTFWGISHDWERIHIPALLSAGFFIAMVVAHFIEAWNKTDEHLLKDDIVRALKPQVWQVPFLLAASGVITFLTASIMQPLAVFVLSFVALFFAWAVFHHFILLFFKSTKDDKRNQGFKTAPGANSWVAFELVFWVVLAIWFFAFN